MTPEFASELIRDMQIHLRRSAGVPSYDPDDPALSSVPSIDEAVFALDPSAPDYLCCTRCHGLLPRGVNSTICIFCGEKQRREGITMSMCFNSTAAFRNLLQSLDLDGSEIVNLETESKGSDKGLNSPKGSITLSDLLNLELMWPREVEENDSSISCNARSHIIPTSLSGINLNNFFSDQKNEISSSPPLQDSHVDTRELNLSSLDLDNLFSSTRNETSSSAQNAKAQQDIPKEQIIDTLVLQSSGSQNTGFFESHQTLDEAQSSDQAEAGDLNDNFDEWETEFQAASSATIGDMSKVIDPLQNPLEYRSDSSEAVPLQHRTIDLFQSHEANPAANSEISRKIDHLQNPANFQLNNTPAVTLESITLDLFPNSMTSHSKNSETVAQESGDIALLHNLSDDQYYSGSVAQDFCPSDRFHDSTNFFSHPLSTSSSDQKMNTAHGSDINGNGGGLTHPVDQLASSNLWFQENLWSETNAKTTMEADQVESVSNIKNEENACVNSSLTEDDDLFDDWQDFTTSTTPLGDMSSSQAQTRGRDKFSGYSSGAEDLEEMEFGSFKQSAPFLRALDDLQSSSDLKTTNGDASVEHRWDQNNDETGNSSISQRTSVIPEDIPVVPHLDASKSRVDLLLARMPDLSFMLEETISLPKKSHAELNA